MSDNHFVNDPKKWVEEYSDMLYQFALKRIADKEYAKDLVQETFISAWKNVHQFNASASFKTWIVTILKNKIIDHYRKTAVNTQSTMVEAESVFFDEADHWREGYYPVEWQVTATADNKLESFEFMKVLQSCKSKLKEIQQQVFALKYLEGMESEEICKALSITSANYWVIIHRAKVQLRACLEKKWFA
ncbi:MULTISPECIES: sigma-70 family RNA polymerase sigma factor [unclassified Paraflavitalea]|uniref:sigma-70 family RNA polymerase sigma factor n=1 Tax=unclassified Paraflavitalea TaxID=2798305 RepID=UPI003D33BE35